MKRQSRLTTCHTEVGHSCLRRGNDCSIRFMHRGKIDWQAVIRDYRTRHLANHRAEVQRFESCRSLAVAIEKAALAEDQRGKRYSHQRRIPKEALKAASKKLGASKNAIRKCRSFDKLHGLILGALKDIRGIGELYCYDTTLRIGAKRGLRPCTVLLHAGTRIGAKAIADTRGKHCLTGKDLPPELRRLPPEQVEDILCIYKNMIKRWHR